MRKPKSHLKAFLTDNAGATAIEYALIGGLISVGIIGAMIYYSEQMTTMFGIIEAAILAVM